MFLLRPQSVDLLPQLLLLNVELLELAALKFGLLIEEFDLPLRELSVANSRV
jgi:hypothetical protein